MKLSVILESEEQEEQQLHPEFWDEDRNLYPEIRERLLELAKDFQDQHYLPDDSIEDITLTGSLANFNWTEYSDVDLHILADFGKIENNPELLDDYYRVAKSLWNNSHEIDICGHEVEIYVQKVAEEHHSTGVYSIMNGEWLTEPKETTSEKPEESLVKEKAESIICKIDRLEEMVDTEPEEVLDASQKLKDKIKKMRKSGLTERGEYSLENLAFKHLRNNGHLDRLSSLTKSAYDQKHSVEECPTESADPFPGIHTFLKGLLAG